MREVSRDGLEAVTSVNPGLSPTPCGIKLAGSAQS